MPEPDRRKPIERLIDAAGLRCTVCGAPMGRCACWTRCPCGWCYRKGDRCRNPIHAEEVPHATD
jgi:hypothetical protein